METRLLDLLVCPVCKGPLQHWRPPEHERIELVCNADRLAFPVRDGIPVMLEGEARSLDRSSDAPDTGGVSFDVIVPARLASTRLPRKPLAEIGGVPMIVRVAWRAAQSKARSVVVAADHQEIVAACRAHGVQAVLTDPRHPTGSDRLSEATSLLGMDESEIVVNVQGDEPMIEPALVDACAALLDASRDCVMSTVAHPISRDEDFASEHVVKVVLDAGSRAQYFACADPWPRGRGTAVDAGVAPPLRHVGLYAYRVGFLRRFPTLAPSPLEAIEQLEQLRVLWHGERIAVHVSPGDAGIGIDTPADLERARALFVSGGGAGFA